MDTTLISVSAMRQYLLDFIDRKPDNSKWKDFYESSTGTLFVELIATLGSYAGFQALMARRESYLPTARIRTSGVGIAQTLGYPVYRGKNEHITITVNPNSTIVLDKYSVIGSCADKDLVTVSPVNLIYGEEISFEVAIGNLKEEQIVIDSDKTTYFRFTLPNVSEDFIITLNDTEVPIDREILKLIDDYYVVLSNSLGSVDVLYLNRPEPSNWVNNATYLENQFVKPKFDIRPDTYYEIGKRVTANNGLNYESTNSGYTGATEPIWNTEVGSLTVDNEVTWKCLGEPPTRIYFKNIAPGQSHSGITEPIWPMIPGQEILDNEVIWLCVRDTYFSLYQYDTEDILKLTYVELGEIVYTESDIDLFYGALLSYKITNKFTAMEDIDSIKINAPLYHETKHIVRGRQDYRKLFKELLPSAVDTNGHDLSPAIVELTYAKDHTTTLWEPKLLVSSGEMIMPSEPNTFIYRSINSGYTASGSNGITGAVEPTWPSSLGEMVVDNQITWICTRVMVTGTPWEASTVFNINTKIVEEGYEYMIYSINAEPAWLTTIGSQIIDNEITWECIDTIYIQGYEANTWEVNSTVTEGDFIFPIVPKTYFYIAKNSGLTGTSEPTWPTVIGNQVIDNEVTWECYDLINAEKYEKNIVFKKLISYRVFGVEPPVLRDPDYIYVKLNVLLYMVSRDSTLMTKIKEDVDNIIEKYESTLEKGLEIHDIEEECEKLSYVKIARITVIQETKSDTWASEKTYIKNDVVYPTTPNGFCYECYYIRNSAESGESQGTNKGYTGGYEPTWPTTEGETIVDNHIVWECVALSGTPETWQRNLLYNLNDTIVPTTPNGFMYIFSSIESLEPIWPTTVNESIVDHDIYWVAREPSLFVPSCSWKEYYIIGRSIEVTV